MSKKQVDISAMLLISIVVIVAAGIVFSVILFSRDPIETELNDEHVFNTLFVFEDNKKPIGAYVVLFYPVNKRVTVFEIPGEIGLILRNINRVDRIDTVYESSRISPYAREIEKLLDIKINYTIAFDMAGLGKFVDLLDGITLFIPGGIEYFDGENTVVFSSGLTKLDGDKTKTYLTFHSTDLETETLRQRNRRFFIAFLRRIGEKRDYLLTPRVNQLFLDFMRTNMNNRTLVKLINEFSNINTDRLTVTSIAGITREVSGQRLLLPYYDGNLIKEIVRQSLYVLTRPDENSDSDRVWTVEVLNGTSAAGLAGRTAELIRGFGYDVINIGNADRSDYEKTEVIDRSAAPNEGKVFADIINCKNIREETVEYNNQNIGIVMDISDYGYKADFTLIIGRDFNGRYTQ